MSYSIGVDIGTTSIKALACASSGKVLGVVQMENHLYHPQPGYSEQNASEILQAVAKLIRDLVLQQSSLPAVVSFSAAMHSLLAVDECGEPLTPVLTWADTRSQPQAARLKANACGQRLYGLTGTPIHPMTPLCKLLWWKENDPALFQKAYKFISLKEYLFYQFFGEYVIDYSVASATGLFDIRRLQWCEEALQLAGITTSQLSEPVPPTRLFTRLRREWVGTLSLLANTPFVIGASDGCLANLGSGAIHAGVATLTIGTSAAVRMGIPEPVTDPQERIFNYYLAENLYVAGGASNNGGIVLEWYAEKFLQKPFHNTADFSAFLEQIRPLPAGAEGLLFLPYVLGERAPVWDATARGVFVGVALDHTQAHFMRAIVEGISFNLYAIARSLMNALTPIQKVLVSGGFAQSALWVQLLADLFGIPMCVTNTNEASGLGAALLGWKALEVYPDWEIVRDIVQIEKIYEPDAVRHARYEALFEIYEGLYASLKGSFGQLAAFRS